MTEPTPGPLPPPPRRSHGCLWGCLIAGGLVVALIVGGMAYMGWFVMSGFKNDAQVHSVIVAMNENATARAELGDRIELDSISSISINDDLNAGKTLKVTAAVKGSKAEGTIDATVNTKDGKTAIQILILHAPDGKNYDLTDPATRAPPGSI
jgi:Cytochrome oxidase complex assembly protein 1